MVSTTGAGVWQRLQVSASIHVPAPLREARERRAAGPAHRHRQIAVFPPVSFRSQRVVAISSMSKMCACRSATVFPA